MSLRALPKAIDTIRYASHTPETRDYGEKKDMIPLEKKNDALPREVIQDAVNQIIYDAIGAKLVVKHNIPTRRMAAQIMSLIDRHNRSN